jgi:hypothetical protein
LVGTSGIKKPDSLRLCGPSKPASGHRSFDLFSAAPLIRARAAEFFSRGRKAEFIPGKIGRGFAAARHTHGSRRNFQRVGDVWDSLISIYLSSDFSD